MPSSAMQKKFVKDTPIHSLPAAKFGSHGTSRGGRKSSPGFPPLAPEALERKSSDQMDDEEGFSDASDTTDDDGISRKGYTLSHIVQGPFSQSVPYGTLLFPIYYQPPRPKETGETAEQINTRIHPPFIPQTRELYVNECNGKKALLYKIGPGAVAFKVVLNTFNNAGMRHTAGNNWNLLWAKRVDASEWGGMGYYSRVNHFPGTWGIGRKDQLHKNVTRFKKAFGEPFNFTPQTWLLPQDTKLLAADMSSTPGLTYILKPCASACGRGIRLITKIPTNKIRSSVVQRYIPNPYLIRERKFDMRLYVAVTSFDPLRVYIFDEGLCRFTAEKYPGPGSNLSSSYAHLTNYSISKTAILQNEEKSADGCDGPKDIKWMLSDLKGWFYARGEGGKQEWAKITHQIKDVVIKTFMTVETDVCNAAAKVCKFPNGHGCFELFGFDLMIDSNCKVYVLECNIMPSLATGNPMDKAVKNRLLAHLLTLVGVAPYDRDEVAKEEQLHTYHPSSRELNRTCTFVNGKYPTGRKRVESKAFYDSLTDHDRRLIIESESEYYRSGGFTRVFPTSETWENYGRFFEVNRYRNELLARWEAEKDGERARRFHETGERSTERSWDVPVSMSFET
eukprot:TRINITY_DN797_c3_g1_i3.p1 TRINITY_DN797_c3_g1~~TRINITY_DN797_c3_g1_i3.p1  ORF type:complete len:707 (+),score=116.37 TRINITY_DN797_c3_g1_i3:262-2121(+)